MNALIIVLLVGLMGGFVVFCTLTKPSWFWNHRKARLLRRILGDTITTIFYMVMGIMMIGIGLFGFIAKLMI